MLKNLCHCPIFQYTSVKSFNDGDTRYNTVVDKFEMDMRELLDAGYKSLSLDEYRLYINQFMDDDSNEGEDKYFSLVFLGGYLNNYTNVFPILKKLGIKASLFIPTNLVGYTSYPGMPNFTPHFGWDAAREMVDSGLIKIYPQWHIFDDRSDFMNEIIRKKSSVEHHLPNNGECFAIARCDASEINMLKSVGYSAFLVDCRTINAGILASGGLPIINVEHKQSIMDVVHQFDFICNLMFSREPDKFPGMVQKAEIDYTKPIELPVVFQPMVKNYLRHAVPLGIIEAFDKKRAEQIVINDYINLSYKPAYNEFDYNNDIYEYWDCLDCQKINNEILKYNNINPVEYVINGLHRGYYADVWLDAYYIPGKYDYKKNHNTHGLFIYGYNPEQKIFLCTTYTDRLLYERIGVKADDFVKATSSYAFATLALLKNNMNASVTYDIKRLYKRLSDYINSVIYDDPSFYHKETTDQYHQINACKTFAEYIQNSGNIPMTAMYCFAEHKRIMAWRIEYICQRENILLENSGGMSEEFIKASEWLITASVKSTLQHSKSLLYSITEKMKYLNNKEEIEICELLARLKLKYNWIDQ